MVKIGNDWDDLLKGEFEKEYYQRLRLFLKDEYEKYVVYPSMYDIFNALKYTSFEDVKVVLLGQDPYHGAHQAHGLCFSVQKGVKVPPSLRNIFVELKDDCGCEIPSHGDLTKWAHQGVLMLNSVLTVREGLPNSHANKGWEQLTDAIIRLLNDSKEHLVFILWGKNAQSKVSMIDESKHLVLKCAHPSPLSAYHGFFGCRHFSKANDFLLEHNIREIDWKIDNDEVGR